MSTESNVNTYISSLRTLVHASPSKGTWTALCNALSAPPDKASLALGIEYLESHLSTWPDALRTAPDAWRGRILGWQAEPCWALVRSLTMLHDEHWLIERLVNTGALLPLTRLALHPKAFNQNTQKPHNIVYLTTCPHLSGLTALDLSGYTIGAEGVRYITTSRVLSQLTQLTLAWNSIGEQGTSDLSSSPFLSNLEHLDLRGCGIGDLGARHLATAAPLQALKRLELGFNAIGQKGALQLANSEHLPEPIRHSWRTRASAPLLILEDQRGIIELGRRFTLFSGETVRIGRHWPRSEMVFPLRSVAGVHLTLEHQGQAVVVTDESGAAGTVVNGGRITTPTVLRSGDQLGFGDVLLQVVEAP